MNTVELVERHRRVQLICHAIRHLLDHSPDVVNSADVDAIDILQSAINPVETTLGSKGHTAPQFMETTVQNTATPAQHEDSLEHAV